MYIGWIFYQGNLIDALVKVVAQFFNEIAISDVQRKWYPALLALSDISHFFCFPLEVARVQTRAATGKKDSENESRTDKRECMHRAEITPVLLFHPAKRAGDKKVFILITSALLIIILLTP